MPQSQRILVFTDSRGELKKAFPDEPIYTERFESHLTALGHSVELMLCPFKWTTTIDFIELIERGFVRPREYDRVILHTGIVEWSPRNVSNLDEVLDGNAEPIDPSRLLLRGKRPRFANDKRSFFRAFFGRDLYDAHCDRRFTTTYRGEPTNNLVSREMVSDRVIPYLREAIGDERLIVINTNRIVAGWEGNYLDVNSDGRPANLRELVDDYATLWRDGFTNIIDLSAWSDDEIRRFTVDNMHFTKRGSDWVFDALVRELDAR